MISLEAVNTHSLKRNNDEGPSSCWLGYYGNKEGVGGTEVVVVSIAADVDSIVASLLAEWLAKDMPELGVPH